MHHWVIWPTVRPISPWKWCNPLEKHGSLSWTHHNTITTYNIHPFFVVSSSTRKSSTKQKLPHLPSTKPSIIVRLLWAHSPHSFERLSPCSVEVQAWVTPEAQPKTWRYKGVATPPIKKKSWETIGNLWTFHPKLNGNVGSWQIYLVSKGKSSSKASFLDFMLIFRSIKIGKRKRMTRFVVVRHLKRKVFAIFSQRRQQIYMQGTTCYQTHA